MVEIQLYEGWNELVYTGPARPAGEILAEVYPYLRVMYYLRDEVEWVLVRSTDLMITGGYYAIRVSQDVVWTYEEEIRARVVRASGSVYNNTLANVAAEFRVNLWTEIWDEDGVRVEPPSAVDSELTGVVAARGRSGTLTLQAEKVLGPGWFMEAWVTLDRLSPAPLDLIKSTGREPFAEPVPEVYGGSLEGFSPTISALGEELLAGIPGVARVT